MLFLLMQTEGLKSDPDAEKPYVVYRKLLGWVTIWWRYPQGMNALMQVLYVLNP